MCDERERLIGYVYDECPPGERQAIEDHLTACSTCREEIGGLRRVRQDLLAWDVPQHDPIWRPLVTPRPIVPVWEQVPAWAMAVAAGLMLMVGAAGGAATSYVFFPQRAAQVAQAPAAVVTPAAAPTPAAVTAADLRALEARVLEAMRSEVRDQAQMMATHTQDVKAPEVDVDAVALQVARTLLPSINRDMQKFEERQARTERLARNDRLVTPISYGPR